MADGCDHVDFFPAQITSFARMRIQSGHHDARIGNAKLLFEIGMKDG